MRSRADQLLDNQYSQREENTCDNLAGKPHISTGRGPEGGPTIAPGGTGPAQVVDADLAFVVACWPAMPEALRQQVVAMVKQAAQGDSQASGRPQEATKAKPGKDVRGQPVKRS